MVSKCFLDLWFFGHTVLESLRTIRVEVTIVLNDWIDAFGLLYHRIDIIQLVDLLYEIGINIRRILFFELLLSLQYFFSLLKMLFGGTIDVFLAITALIPAWLEHVSKEIHDGVVFRRLYWVIVRNICIVALVVAWKRAADMRLDKWLFFCGFVGRRRNRRWRIVVSTVLLWNWKLFLCLWKIARRRYFVRIADLVSAFFERIMRRGRLVLRNLQILIIFRGIAFTWLDIVFGLVTIAYLLSLILWFVWEVTFVGIVGSWSAVVIFGGDWVRHFAIFVRSLVLRLKGILFREVSVSFVLVLGELTWVFTLAAITDRNLASNVGLEMARTKRLAFILFLILLLLIFLFFGLIVNHIAAILILHIQIDIGLLEVVVRIIAYQINLKQLTQFCQYSFHLIISLQWTCPLGYLLQNSKHSLIHLMILGHYLLKTKRIFVFHHYQKLAQMLIMYLISTDLGQASVEYHILHDL